MRKISDIAKELETKIEGFKPETAIILGSGLGVYADNIDIKYSVDFSQLHGFPKSGVAGHSGKFLFGRHKGKNVAIMAGRIHYYEGYPMSEVVMAIRVFKLLGITNLIITNAAGGVNADFDKGDIMAITDHISLFCPNPLIGANLDELGPRFPDMTNIYDKQLLALAQKCADKAGFDLKKGVYCYQTGPSYESVADVAAIRALKGDCVGMSTVPEAIIARHAGMRICGFSYIANKAAGLIDEELSHEDVLQAFEISKDKFFLLLDGMLEGM